MIVFFIMRKSKVLFIGLGRLGFHMSSHLSKCKNIDLFVYNRSKNKLKLWSKKNKSFFKNAPKQIVDNNKKDLIDYKFELKKLNSILNSIKN